MSGQGMQMPQSSYSNMAQPQNFNQQFEQQNMGLDSQPRYGQFQNQQAMQQPVQPTQQPNYGLLQPFGGNQLGYRPPMQQQMQQPMQQPAPSLLNQQMPTMQQAPMQQPMQQAPMQQPSIQQMLSQNFDPIEAQRMQDYYAQDAISQAKRVQRLQERMNQQMPLAQTVIQQASSPTPREVINDRPLSRLPPAPTAIQQQPGVNFGMERDQMPFIINDRPLSRLPPAPKTASKPIRKPRLLR